MPFIKHIEILEDRKDNKVFPFDLPSIQSIGKLALHPTINFFVGENGTGKSTLLEAIAVSAGFNHEGGSRNFNFSSSQEHSRLSDALRVSRTAKRPRDGFFYRAESFYNVITEMNNLDDGPGGRSIKASYGGRNLHTRSHGEAFMDLVLNRFAANGLYLLDEPEAALSPQRQLSLLVRIAELAEQQSQFIIATHSPILIAYPGAKIWEFTDSGLVEKHYADTENYRLMKSYFSNTEGFMDKLFSPEQDV
jgi:predicted ATPase